MADPTEKNYEPWDGPEYPNDKFPDRVKNLEAKDWAYTVEIEREITPLAENNPTEDALLGVFAPHPGP